MPKIIKFVLSDETDKEFRAALEKRKDFPHYKVVDVTRDEVVQGGQKIPVGVITLDL